MSVRFVVSVLVAALPAANCARYRPAPLDVERPLRAASAPGRAIWTYDNAVRYAIEHNPDLAALRARADAVNVNPAREPVEGSVGADSDHRGEFGVSFDALSLLGLGTRPFDVALACARRDEAWMTHHARAREVAGEIAEAFVVDRALASLPALAEPEYRVDVAAFVRAGLESGASEMAAASTVSKWEAESAERAAESRSNRLALARLLGIAPGIDVQPASVVLDWPLVGEPTASALIASRTDVQRRIASFETADRDVRRLVRAQYPSIMLEPGVATRPAALFGAVRIKLPVGLRSEVYALESAREAARSDVESAVLDAMREAGETKVRWTVSKIALAAARKRVESAAALLKGSRVRLEIGSGSPIESVMAADAVVDGATTLRNATLDEAHARVRAARAAGWPGGQWTAGARPADSVGR